jgi:hypothetical protein
MFKSKILLSITSVALLACAQQEEPAPMVMSAEPVYNKMGDVVGCTDGRTYVPGTAPMDPCAPPGEECEPGNYSSAAPGECPPPKREDDDDTTGRNPTRG